MTMIEPFEKQGTWWLPDQERRVQGTLRFDPKDGISVALSEPLAAGSTDNQTHTSKIIHGRSIDGKKISLLDCFELITTTNFTSDGIFSGARLIAKQCVSGAHLSESTKFNNHNFILHNFLQFYCRKGIHIDFNHEIGYVWDRVNPLILPIGEDQITIDIVAQSSFHLFEHAASIKEDAIISIDTAIPVDNLDEAILGSFQTIKAMLEFSLGYPVPIIQFQSVATNGCGKSENIDVFISQSVYDTKRFAIPQQDMLFSFCSMSDESISEFISKWHAFYNENRFTVDVIINSGVQSDGDKHPEQSFFFLISSLEALHRYKKANNVKLKKRLNDVLDDIPQRLHQRIKNRNDLIDNFINYRTSIAHQKGYSKINNSVISKWHLTVVLWAITVIYALKIMGFSDDQFNDILANRRNMMNARNWIGEVSVKWDSDSCDSGTS